jgi:transcriptional regulator of heat shock response
MIKRHGMATEQEGASMANIDTQKLMNFDNLSSEQKEELKKRFQERKRELETALKTVNESLEKLGAAR